VRDYDGLRRTYAHHRGVGCHRAAMRWFTGAARAALLSLVLIVAAQPSAAAPIWSQQTATATPTPLGIAPISGTVGTITVAKAMCASIGGSLTCNGNDQSLLGDTVDFNVYDGPPPTTKLDTVLTVTLNQAGGGSGQSFSALLSLGTYTVCEVPVAKPPGGSG